MHKAKSGAESPSYAATLAALGHCFLQEQKWSDAERSLADALKIRQTKEATVWTTFNTESMLGAALLGRKDYIHAEPLLRSGYEGMKRLAGKIPARDRGRMVEALDRLIALARATSNEKQAKAWITEKDALNDKAAVSTEPARAKP